MLFDNSFDQKLAIEIWNFNRNTVLKLDVEEFQSRGSLRFFFLFFLTDFQNSHPRMFIDVHIT